MADESSKRKKGHERRIAERVDTWLNTSFQAGDKQWRMGYIRDISETGAHIITLEPLQPGERTAIVLENIQDLENIMVVGKVIWKIEDPRAKNSEWDAPSMGVEFEEVLPITATCFVQSDNGKTSIT